MLDVDTRDDEIFKLKNDLYEAQQTIKTLTAEKGDGAKAELDHLEHIISSRMGPIPLPPAELRLHVGSRTTTSNFLLQGWQSQKKVRELFGDDPADTVLDWGCGCGRTLRWLMAHPGWVEKYRGTDVDHMAIDWLKERGIDNVSLCTDTRIMLPYEDRSIGGLFSFSVLTHIKPEQFRDWFREIARILKPGALAYLTFNGDTIVTNTPPGHEATAAEFTANGSVWIEHAGNYKSAAYVSHDLVREAAEGIFTIDKIAARDFSTMDALYARPVE